MQVRCVRCDVVVVRKSRDVREWQWSSGGIVCAHRTPRAGLSPKAEAEGNVRVGTLITGAGTSSAVSGRARAPRTRDGFVRAGGSEAATATEAVSIAAPSWRGDRSAAPNRRIFLSIAAAAAISALTPRQIASNSARTSAQKVGTRFGEQKDGQDADGKERQPSAEWTQDADRQRRNRAS